MIPTADRKNLRSDVFARAAAIDEAVEHVATELPRRAIDGEAAASPRHLIDEVHQAQIEVVLDQREGAEADAGAGAGVDFFQSSSRRALERWVHQDEIAAFEMGGRLAVGDADDLLVARRLLLQRAAGEAQAGLD